MFLSTTSGWRIKKGGSTVQVMLEPIADKNMTGGNNRNDILSKNSQ
jgi:hypothetical protein